MPVHALRCTRHLSLLRYISVMMSVFAALVVSVRLSHLFEDSITLVFQRASACNPVRCRHVHHRRLLVKPDELDLEEHVCSVCQALYTAIYAFHELTLIRDTLGDLTCG